MNAINIIAPYKCHGMWVFDDARVGLVQEPFVAGADTMIDRVVTDIPDVPHSVHGGGYAVNTTLQDEFSALGLCFRHRDFCIAATHCSIDEAARSP